MSLLKPTETYLEATRRCNTLNHGTVGINILLSFVCSGDHGSLNYACTVGSRARLDPGTCAGRPSHMGKRAKPCLVAAVQPNPPAPPPSRAPRAVASHAATPTRTINYAAVQGILDSLVQGELEDGSAILSLFDQNLKMVEKLSRRRPIDTECILAAKAAKIAVLVTECADIMVTFTSGVVALPQRGALLRHHAGICLADIQLAKS